MNKKNKNNFFVITLIILAIVNISSICATPDPDSDGIEYLMITDINVSELDDCLILGADKWLITEAEIIPKLTASDDYSFNLVYPVFYKNKRSNVSLHIRGYKNPVEKHSISILYNKDDAQDIIILGSTNNIAPEVLTRLTAINIGIN